MNGIDASGFTWLNQNGAIKVVLHEPDSVGGIIAAMTQQLSVQRWVGFERSYGYFAANCVPDYVHAAEWFSLALVSKVNAGRWSIAD